MTFRTRIAVTAAVAVALAFLVTAVGLYAATARTLRGEVDRSLSEIARDLDDLRDRPFGRARFGARAGAFGGAGGFVQVVDRDGEVLGVVGDSRRLPVTDDVRDVAVGARSAFLTTTDVGGQPVRVLTVPVAPGLAAQVARPLAEVEASLATLRNRLTFGALLGVGLAAALGTVVARRAVRPVVELTAVAEQVAATGDLSRRIGHDAEGPDDELARLARTFDAMLANLEQARAAQQQLVADASHELRTPLTSVRTNIETLALDTQPSTLDADDRRALLEDLRVQLDEFGRLVSALVELARGAQPARATTPVQLDELVEAAVDRARAFTRNGQRIDVTSEPVVVHGEEDRLDRAVTNLLDNAVKYGGGGPIEVWVGRKPAGNGSVRAADGVRARTSGTRASGTAAVVRVRDHGPGIAPEHRPHVFDRFYRAPDARGSPGSGLGLSIVRQVAEAHGGTATLAPADDGGTVVTVELPCSGPDTRASGATVSGAAWERTAPIRTRSPAGPDSVT